MTTDNFQERFSAGVALDAATERILNERFNGDRGRYVEALSIASKRQPLAFESYAENWNLPFGRWDGDDSDFGQRAPERGAELDRLARKVLERQFSGDMSHYPEALSIAARRGTETFAEYQAGPSMPLVPGNPPYNRLMDPKLAARGNDTSGNWPIGNNPSAPGYAARGLVQQKIAKAASKFKAAYKKARAGMKAMPKGSKKRAKAKKTLKKFKAKAKASGLAARAGVVGPNAPLKTGVSFGH